MGGLPEISHEVRLRKVQTRPVLRMASPAQRIADEVVSSDSECSRCSGDDQNAAASVMGRKSSINGGTLGVPVSARCKMGFARYAMWHRLCFPGLLYQHCCWRRALSKVDDGTIARMLLRVGALPPDFCLHRAQAGFLACDDHWLVIAVFHLEVLALGLSCEGSSDRGRDRDRDRET